jgi:signal transduction histidine kinase
LNVDPRLISSAFQNIIKNAVEALPKENPVISLKTSLYCENDLQWARIIITDNGKGISKENLNRIFQPYFTNKPKGSGLGLTIANEIIQQHKGRIMVESNEGKGTSFIIDLPLT